MPTPSDRPVLAAKIDWYSFTLPCPTPITGIEYDDLPRLSDLLRSVFDDRLERVNSDSGWSIVNAKGFYNYRATHEQSKIAVSWGEVNAHVFVECPGQACDWLREVMAFSDVVARTYQRASRIDAAIDITTATSPADFISCGYASRFSESVGDIRSKTGDTCYIGSRKSDRCARVYRYADPHPRSHLLRVESEFKGKAAKALALVLATEGDVAAVRSAHRVFEWASSEVMMDFLARQNFAPGQVIDPVMENTAGSCPPSFLPLNDMSERDWWTFSAGYRRWYYRRWRRQNPM